MTGTNSTLSSLSAVTPPSPAVLTPDLRPTTGESQGGDRVSCLEAALAYARASLHVFPIDDDSKVPLPGSHGYLDGTTDTKQIEEWWTERPTARIALALRPSGLIAFDVDPRNGGTETLAKLEREHGPLPRSNHQRSGSGGEHIVMRDPSPGPNGWTRTQATGGACRGSLGRGIDIKCNGYIVVEPSGSYEWLSFDPDNVAPVPEAYIKLLRKPAEEVTLAGAGVEYWTESTHRLDDDDDRALRRGLVELGPRGAKNTTTLLAVKRVFHDFGQGIEDGAPYLLEWNKQNGAPHSTSELTRQIKRIANKIDDEGARALPRGWLIGRDAMLRSFKTRGARAYGTSWREEVDHALRDVQAALGTADDATAREPLFFDVAELFERDYPETPWLVGGLITRGGQTTIGGEPKTTKTWLATEIAVAVATGTPVCGEFVAERGRSAYFFAEDLDKQVRNRVRALLAFRGLDRSAVGGRLFVRPRGKFLDVTRDIDLAWLVASCRKLGPLDVLVLDPLRDVHGGEEDKSDSMRNVMRSLRVLGELLGCTIVVVHHASKATGDTSKRRGGQRLRGSGAVHGSTDCGIYLGGLDGDGQTEFSNTVESEVKGARSAGKFDLELVIEDNVQGEAVKATWTVRRKPSDEQKQREDARHQDEQEAADDAKVIAKVGELQAADASVSATDLRIMVPGVPDKRVRASIARLVPSHLQITKSGRNSFVVLADVGQKGNVG